MNLLMSMVAWLLSSLGLPTMEVCSEEVRACSASVEAEQPTLAEPVRSRPRDHINNGV